MRNAGGDRVQLSLNLRLGDPVLNASNGEHPFFFTSRFKPVDSIQRGFIRHGNEDFQLHEFFRPIEIFGRNADDGVGMFIDTDNLPHDVGIAVKPVLPCWPGDHGYLCRSGMIVVGAPQQSPEKWLDVHNLEELPTHLVSPRRPGDTVDLHAEHVKHVRPNRGENRVPLAHVAHFWIGVDRVSLLAACERHHAVRMRDIQRLQDQRLQHSEDDDVGRDT